MTYKFTVTEKPLYLHFIISGELSKENVLRYFEEIHRECTARSSFMILIEEHLDGSRLSVISVIELVSEERSKSRGFFKAIAYVDVNAESNSMNFIENAAVNRGLPLKVFSTVANAEKWLLNKAR